MKSNKEILKFIDKSLFRMQSITYKERDLAGIFMIARFDDAGLQSHLQSVTATEFFSDLRENLFKLITISEKKEASDEYKERLYFHAITQLIKGGNIMFLDPTEYGDNIGHHIGYIYIPADELDYKSNDGYISNFIEILKRIKG